MPIKTRSYGALSSGEEVHSFELSDGHVQAEILSYGAVRLRLSQP